MNLGLHDLTTSTLGSSERLGNGPTIGVILPIPTPDSWPSLLQPQFIINGIHFSTPLVTVQLQHTLRQCYYHKMGFRFFQTARNVLRSIAPVDNAGIDPHTIGVDIESPVYHLLGRVRCPININCSPARHLKIITVHNRFWFNYTWTSNFFSWSQGPLLVAASSDQSFLRKLDDILCDVFQETTSKWILKSKLGCLKTHTAYMIRM